MSRYPLTVNCNDGVMCDVLCAVRAQPDTLDKMQMKCSLSSRCPIDVETPATLDDARHQSAMEGGTRAHPNTPHTGHNSDRSSKEGEACAPQMESRDHLERQSSDDLDSDVDPDLDPGHRGGYPLLQGQYQLSNVVCLESKGKPLSFDVSCHSYKSMAFVLVIAYGLIQFI